MAREIFGKCSTFLGMAMLVAATGCAVEEEDGQTEPDVVPIVEEAIPEAQVADTEDLAIPEVQVVAIEDEAAPEAKVVTFETRGRVSRADVVTIEEEEAIPEAQGVAVEEAGELPEADVVTIEVGTLGGPALAAAWVEREALSFMEAYPHIRIETIDLSRPLRPENGTIDSLPRLAKHVIGIVGLNSYEASYLASRDLIVPIEQFLPDPNFSMEAFSDNHWPIVTYDGKIWGVPWILNSLSLVCDWALFEAEGIAEPPRTWEEFFSYAKRLTKDTDGDGEIDEWGFRVPHFGYVIRPIMLLAMSLQKHLENGLDDMGLWAKDPITREQFKILDTFYHSDAVKHDNALAFIGASFQSPREAREPYRCAMQALYNYSLNSPGIIELGEEVQAYGARYRHALLPTYGPKATLAGDERYLAVRKSTPEEERASWEFVKWMSRKNPGVDGAAYWHGWPARKDHVEAVNEYAANYGNTLNGDRHLRLEAADWTQALLPSAGRLYKSRVDLERYTIAVLMRAFDGRITYDEAARQIDLNLATYGWTPEEVKPKEE